MKIAVFGAGAIGGYFGGRLSAAGEDVTFIARGKTLEALRTHGLRLTSAAGDLHLPSPQATDDPAMIGKVDLVVVGVKTWQVREAAVAMKPLIGDGTAVLPLQNGVEASPDLAAVLGPKPVLGGTCRVISRVEEPAHIVHTGTFASVELGELDDSRSERIEAIASALSGAGVTTRVSDDIHVALWAKFLFLATTSGLGAVTRAPIGVLRKIPETRRMLDRGMREIAAVAVARGVRLPADEADKALVFIDGLPPEGTASMQRDIMDGRPSELEAQNGAVVRLGREAGVEAPVHEFLYASLLPMERAARDRQ